MYGGNSTIMRLLPTSDFSIWRV